MQQERSFLRRLYVVKIDINEPKFNARRAYFLIPLAVKTSRPQFLKDCKVNKILGILPFFFAKKMPILNNYNLQKEFHNLNCNNL
jgi:hypothetical protein